MLPALWALLGFPTQISHPNSFLPPDPVKGQAELLLPMPGAHFGWARWMVQDYGESSQALGSTVLVTIRADIMFLSSWTISLPQVMHSPRASTNVFLQHQSSVISTAPNPAEPTAQGKMQAGQGCVLSTGISCTEIVQANSEQIERQIKMVVSPLMAWLAVAEESGHPSVQASSPSPRAPPCWAFHTFMKNKQHWSQW